MVINQLHTTIVLDLDIVVDKLMFEYADIILTFSISLGPGLILLYLSSYIHGFSFSLGPGLL